MFVRYERKIAELEKEIEYLKQYKKVLMEASVGRAEYIKQLEISIEKVFDNWALGNFDDERFHIEIQLIVHNLKK